MELKELEASPRLAPPVNARVSMVPPFLPADGSARWLATLLIATGQAIAAIDMLELSLALAEAQRQPLATTLARLNLGRALVRTRELDRSAAAGLGRRALRVAFAGLAIAGVATQVVGVVRLGEVQAANEALGQALLEQPVDVVVTDIWFVPQIAPTAYGRVPLLFLRTAEEWEELDHRLEAHGVGRLRLVRLPDQETALASGVEAGWDAVEGSGAELDTIPPLRVIDFVRGEID